MRVALYSRVSTPDQSVDMQLTDLRGYCKQRGFEIYREYCDHGISGTKDRRPALDQLMADSRKRRFGAILVWRFDRFARSTKHLIMALDEFQHLGIDFISYQENIDTSSPLGKAIFTIVSAIGELERNIIVDRIKGGLRRAKALGKHIGRPALTVDREEVLKLKNEGLSMRAIGKRLGFSASMVHKLVKQPT